MLAPPKSLSLLEEGVAVVFSLLLLLPEAASWCWPRCRLKAVAALKNVDFPALGLPTRPIVYVPKDPPPPLPLSSTLLLCELFLVVRWDCSKRASAISNPSRFPLRMSAGDEARISGWCSRLLSYSCWNSMPLSSSSSLLLVVVPALSLATAGVKEDSCQSRSWSRKSLAAYKHDNTHGIPRSFRAVTLNMETSWAEMADGNSKTVFWCNNLKIGTVAFSWCDSKSSDG
mmetsp:Transcript_11503/g.27012  ORF Transcript_11503/g.27012 Transcript_11503/m.27012 type:complete len:229 (-) Transcript_11503:1151-1837(-)